jgi:signal transduction histidine kinase
MVMAHAATLRQVLVNLIGNALKFVASGPPQVRIRAEERPGGVVRVWVEDNGIGIPAEFQERIFQVFQRLHTTEYAGTGIGLAIVKKGVERLGGRVGLESAPRTGSKFWLELTQAPANGGSLPPLTKKP